MPIGLNLNNKGTVFYPPAASNNAYYCTFQRKFEDANAGLSAAYKSFWTKVPDVSDNLYNENPPEAQEKWFSELMDFTISPGITAQYKAIQDKYHPERVYAVHPALNQIWYQDGRKGLRDPRYRPVIDIDPSLPPFINLYNYYKNISDILLGEAFAPTNKENYIPREANPISQLNVKSKDLPVIAI